MDERERAYVAKLMYFTLFFSLQGDLFWSVDLGRSRSARVRTFSGKVLVDIREFYTGRDGQPMPGKKGISLNPEEWQCCVNVLMASMPPLPQLQVPGTSAY